MRTLTATPKFQRKGQTTSGARIPVFIFTGESNSGGRALNSSATAGELASRSSVQIYNNSTLAFQNLDIGTNNLLVHAGLTGTPETTEHSWELGLANSVEANTFNRASVYLIKTGQGGTKIENWAVGNTAYGGVNCWQVFQDRVDAALTLIQTANPGSTLQLYIFFTIGINDAIAGTNVTTWKAAVVAHLQKIRKKYGDGVPIVLTQLMTAYATYSTAISELVATQAETYSIVTSDLTLQVDGNHWTYASMKTMADRLIVPITTNYAVYF